MQQGVEVFSGQGGVFAGADGHEDVGQPKAKDAVQGARASAGSAF